jgi:hypothetical protein
MMGMNTHRVILGLFVLSPLFACGCSSRPDWETERHRHGAKVNILDFVTNTGAYRGKSITLELKVDEEGFRSQGRSLRGYVGKAVRFAILGLKGEQQKVVISIPAGVTIPEDASEEVFVTFVCTRGSLWEGNQARIVEKP